MAHKKGVGSTDNGRDSIGRRLGVKLFGGQKAIAGNIIIRQRGTKFHVGDNVYIGKDHTIHATVDGTVVFNKRRNNRTYVSILPAEGVTTIKPRRGNSTLSQADRDALKAKKDANKAAAATPKDGKGGKAKAAKPAAPKAKKEAPKKEAPKADAPKKEAPKAEAPKQEAPKKEAPKAEAPKKEAPKAEAPKKETPKADSKVTETTKTTKVAPVIGGASTSDMPKGVKENDLTAVEGIGPKIAETLAAAGIDTWEKLGNTMGSKIKEVLEAAEGNFAAHDPTTWPTQAKMAAEGKWALLKAWQDKLDGGKEKS